MPGYTFRFLLITYWTKQILASQLTWSGTIGTDSVTKSVPVTESSSLSVYELSVECSSNTSTYLSVTLRDIIQNKALISSNSLCQDGNSVKKLSAPTVVKKNESLFNVELTGLSGTSYSIELTQTHLEIDWTSKILLKKGEMVIRSFRISEDDIATEGLGYVWLGVTSEDKFLSNNTSERNVAKMFVTQDYDLLLQFYESQQYSYTKLRSLQMLSFSTFGAVTLSNVSFPSLQPGIWYIALVQIPQPGEPQMADKNVSVEKMVVKNYSYTYRILFLVLISIAGVIFPIISRVVFDYNNFKNMGKIRMRAWLSVLMDWTWRGDKGYPYLMTLLMMVLTVGAFQVVNAKWSDMIKFGDRDICYYNERCYRPYVWYDISVNDCASNLPFAIHGVILLLYFSICEAYCKSVGHIHHDYSIPYSFGVTLICEALGSFLYHICPSQIIFQFDTMFMFLMSILMIIGIFEGYSIRKNDIIYHHDLEKAPKALQPSKVICFFVGPVYFFNFIGNWSTTQGLPLWMNVVFYISYSVWLVCVLTWAAYNLGLLNKTFLPLPERPDLATPEDGLTLEHIFTPNILNSLDKRKMIVFKSVLFIAFCIISVVGAILAFLRFVPFSIYLLGILIVAMLTLTCITFIPLMLRLSLWVRKNNIGSVSCGELKFWGSNQIVITVIMVGYILIGVLFSTISLIFFTGYENTDKSLSPWLSRELNNECFADDFFTSHDIWHLMASFSLMIMILVNVQVGKPCRDCYLSYLTADEKETVRRITVRWTNGQRPQNIGQTLQRILKKKEVEKNSSDPIQSAERPSQIINFKDNHDSIGTKSNTGSTDLL
ncbi:hypothetical protein ACHWQZ_G015921 [Mnemiopsis leidyi]